jgi:hypothetical protein
LARHFGHVYQFNRGTNSYRTQACSGTFNRQPSLPHLTVVEARLWPGTVSGENCYHLVGRYERTCIKLVFNKYQQQVLPNKFKYDVQLTSSFCRNNWVCYPRQFCYNMTTTCSNCATTWNKHISARSWKIL